MGLRHIAFGSLRRRAGKATLMVVGLSVAVAAFVLVLSLILSVRAALDDKLTRYGSNLVVTPASEDLSLSYGGIEIPEASGGRVRVLDESALEVLATIPSAGSIAAVVPVLLQPVDVTVADGTAHGSATPRSPAAGAGDGPGAGSSSGRTFLAMGTDIAESLEVKLWWKIEGRPPRTVDEVLLGLNVRNDLDLQVGDRLTVDGHPVTVSGVLWETGGEEDNLVMLDRQTLAAWSGRQGEVNLIEVTAADVTAVDTLSAEIGKALPGAAVSSVKRSIEFTDRANASLERFGLAVTLLIVVISGIVVMITMLTAVKERRREIGVLRAIGYKRRHIARLIVIETLAICGAAAVGGVLLGALGGMVAPVVVPGLTVGFVVDPWVTLGGVVVSFVVGLSAALYPAWRAAGLDPATALRSV